MRVSIVGGSGYVGGELLRLLLFHPRVEVQQVTSESHAGKLVSSVHPNLRKITTLRFSRLEELEPCDLLLAALPHGELMSRMDRVRAIAPRLIDLSADFRFRSAEAYRRWYGHDHARPEALSEFVYGIPELHRHEIRGASCVSGAGCLATAAILGLVPLFKHGLVRNNEAFIEAKVGSSAAGNTASLATHHPERSGAVRSFQPTGHRHTGEIVQELSFQAEAQIHFSATAIELVRGVMITAHLFLRDHLEDRDLWKVYRSTLGEEPFIRIVKDTRGVYRYPEPKILIGSNYCDVSFEKDPHCDRVVVMAALDNLMKGAAGNGVQAMNLLAGWDERLGLEFPGLHPV